MTPQVLTPHAYKKLRAHVRQVLAALRKEYAEIRVLRQSERYLDREDADGRLIMANHWHNEVRKHLRTLRTAQVLKYANISPAAAARLRARRGGG